jgi:diguanylate cyclase (GGDEF)-like protein
VVVVTIDEASLEAVGRWPWPRQRFVELVDSLRPSRPAALGFDILFAEPDANPAADERLATALARSGRAVLPVAGTFQDPLTPAIEVLPIGPLIEAAAGLGHSNIAPDADGRVRRLHLRAGVGVPYWPALASTTLSVAQGRALEPPALAPEAGGGARRGWIAAEEVVLPWAAALERVQRRSFLEANRALAAGAIVLVGVTAAGLGPSYQVPDGLRSRTVRGVELHAAAVVALASGAAVRPVGSWVALLLAALAGGALLLALNLPLQRLLLVAGAAAVASLLASVLLLVLGRLWWGPAPALLGLLLACGVELNRRWLEDRLAAHGLRVRSELALRSIADVVLTTDAQGLILDANAATRTILGVEPASLTGLTLQKALHLPGVADPIASLRQLPGNEPASFDLTLNRPGRPPRELHVTLARFLASRAGGFVVTLRDVTAERQLVRDMAHRATHDALTGLPNRALLDDRIDSSLLRARRAGQAVAIAFIDVDRFKAVNDSLGHGRGDEILRELARRLQEAARESDTVGRIGGDEFVLVLEGLGSERDALPPLERLDGLLAEPVAVDGQKLRLTVSVGVSLFPRDADNRLELLRYADMAMYRAKQTGRDRVVFYAEDMNVEAQDRLWLERELRAALDRDTFFLHYQPRFTLDELRLAGFECLVRWQHLERGPIPPSLFIPVAEETGLICPLGRRIVSQAASALHQWCRGHPDLVLSVNLSVVQLKADDGFVAFVAEALRMHALQPAQLEFEITESLFLDPSLPVVDRRLRDLVDLGVRLAIDDFGTGYSSLNYLRRLPFNAIKIDQSFVRDVSDDTRGRAIIEAIVGLGRSLDKRLVAEGVETQAQLDVIRQLGCHEAQGYLLGRPQPAQDVPRLLAA